MGFLDSARSRQEKQSNTSLFLLLSAPPPRSHISVTQESERVGGLFYIIVTFQSLYSCERKHLKGERADVHMQEYKSLTGPSFSVR